MTDQKAEFHIKEKRQIFRKFSSWYADKRFSAERPKPLNTFKKKIHETDRKQESDQDINYLFGAALLPHIEPPDIEHLRDCLFLLQNTRFSEKYQGDFTIVRDPMYKYSKIVKERFFNDYCMSFLFMYYLVNGGVEDLLDGNDRVVRDVLKEYEALSMDTLKNE